MAEAASDLRALLSTNEPAANEPLPRRTVMVVASNTSVSGGETFLLRLARHAPSLQPPSLFVTLGFGDGRLVRELRALGVRVLDLQAPPLSKPLGTLAVTQRLAAEARVIGAEVILANGTHPFVYAALAGATARIPVGQWMHDVPPRRAVPVAFSERVVHLLRRDALFLCNSHFTLEASMELRPRGARLVVAPPGQEAMDDDEAGTTQLRDALGLHPDKVVLGFAGRMAAIKGVFHMAQALQRCSHLAERAQVLLVGGANLGRELEAPERVAGTIREAGFHAVCTGHVGNVLPYLRVMDVMLAPSVFQETFGLSVMEAMACGKPVIASRIGALPELVQDGATGWLVPPGDASELSRAICQAVLRDDERMERGRAALARVQSRYGVAQMVSAFERALREVS